MMWNVDWNYMMRGVDNCASKRYHVVGLFWLMLFTADLYESLVICRYMRKCLSMIKEW